MGTIELKSNIHRIIDGVEDKDILQAIYDFLRIRENVKDGQLWLSLSESEKQEVLLAYDESEDEENLLSYKALFKSKE